MKRECPYCGAELKVLEVSLPDKLILSEKTNEWIENNTGDWNISCQFCGNVFDMIDIKNLGAPIELVQKIRDKNVAGGNNGN